MKDFEKKFFKIVGKLPKMNCKGHCWDSCGPVPIRTLEEKIIRKFLKRKHLPFKEGMGNTLVCPYLSQDRKCSIYQARPLVCRIWGMAKRLPCNYGCKPDRYMEDREVMSLLFELEDAKLPYLTDEELEKVFTFGKQRNLHNRLIPLLQNATKRGEP